LRDGLLELGLVPKGRTLVKPNLVAAGDMFPHAHTRAEFVEGLLLALQDVGSDTMTELAVGERCGITIPTRYAFKHSGSTRRSPGCPGSSDICSRGTPGRGPLHARKAAPRLRLRSRAHREDRLFRQRAEVQSAPVDDSDLLDEKLHWIQDDRPPANRSRPPTQREVADLQYVIQPQFIAIDAIIAGEGRMLTPTPFDMKLIVMGNNQVAFDAVCCAIIG